MELAPASDDDLEEIVALINSAYRGGGTKIGWTVETSYIAGPRITVAGLRDDLRASPEAVLLRWRDERDHSMLGTVWLKPCDAGVWYLGLLSVRPDLQDRRLGRELLSAAEEVARAGGASRIRISVVALRDTLIAWYERRGYELTGATEPFPYDDLRAGMPLRDDLFFVILEKAL